MGSIKGITIDIGGNTTKLEKALKDVNRTTSALKKELKEVENGLKFNPGNTELLAQKQEILKQSIQQTAEKLLVLKSAQESAQKQFEKGEIGAEQMRSLQREILTAENNLKNLTKQLADTFNQGKTNDIDDVGKEIGEIGKEAEKSSEKVNTLAKNLSSIGEATADIGKGMTQYVTAPITALAGASVKTATDFDSAMSEVAAISGATGEDLQALRDKAREMGETTAKSATESANALKYMALAGWDTSQQIAGIEPILSASIASGGDLATTSDLVTDSMSALGISVDELGGYLDIVTQAQNNSNTTMQDLLTAYIGVGGTLKNLNVPLEESATLLGTLANRGIKGSEAGNKLNSVLVNLIGASKNSATALDELGVSAWNDDGTFKGITATLEELQERLAGATEEQTAMFTAAIGGKTQMDTLQALLSGVNEEYGTLKEKIEDAGGALEATAIIMNDNLGGDFKILQSELESVGISIGEIVTPSVRNLVKEVTDILKSFNNLDTRTKTIITRFALLAAAIGPIVLTLGKTVSIVGTFITTMQSLKTAIATATTAQEVFNAVCEANPYVLVASLLAALVVGVGVYIATLSDADLEQEEFNRKIEETAEKLEQNKEAYESNKRSIEESVTAEEARLSICEKMLPRLEELGNKTDRTTEETDELNRIINDLNNSMPDLGLTIEDETGKLNMNTAAVRDNISAYKDLARAKGAQSLLQEATTEQLKLQKEFNESDTKSQYEKSRQDYVNYQKAYNQMQKLGVSKVGNVGTEGYKGDDSDRVALKNLGLNDNDTIDSIYQKMSKSKDMIDALEENYNEYVKQIDNLESDIDKYSSMYDEYSGKANSSDGKKTKAGSKKTQAEREAEQDKKDEKILKAKKKEQEKAEKEQEKQLEKQRKEQEKAEKEREKQQEEAIKEELAILEYRHEQGEISEEEYYNGLKRIRDKNYTVMSSDWRSITQKMAKIQASNYKSSLEEQEKVSKNYIDRMNNADTWGEDSSSKAYQRIVDRYKKSLAEIDSVAWDSVKQREEYEKYLTEKVKQYTDLQKKAYEDEYKARYEHSSEWISERNFYGDWSDYGDNEVEAWKRVKAYTDESYRNGQLSAKEYGKQIKSIDKSIYSASKSIAEKMVSKIKESEKAKYEAVKERVSKEKELLKDKYNEEDRQEKLAKLREQASYYSSAITKEGQDKYTEAMKGIRDIEREINLENAEKKDKEEMAAAEARYNEAVKNAEALTEMYQNKLIESNAVAIEQQIDNYIELQKKTEEIAENEADNIMKMGESLASGISDMLASYSDEQTRYLQECREKIASFKGFATGVLGSMIGVAGLLTDSGNVNNSKTYNYNHYGDYKFSDKQELDIYNREANSSMLNVFGI